MLLNKIKNPECCDIKVVKPLVNKQYPVGNYVNLTT